MLTKPNFMHIKSFSVWNKRTRKMLFWKPIQHTTDHFWFENQEANLCCSVNRKPFGYDLYTVMKSFWYNVSTVYIMCASWSTCFVSYVHYIASFWNTSWVSLCLCVVLVPYLLYYLICFVIYVFHGPKQSFLLFWSIQMSFTWSF